MHHVINWLKLVQVLRWSFPTETQNTVCLLTVEVLSLRMYTAERILKHVDSIAEVLSKVKHIFGNEALIAGSLCVALVEATPVLGCTPTVRLRAVVKGEVI